jgi:hypothetical protein
MTDQEFAQRRQLDFDTAEMVPVAKNLPVQAENNVEQIPSSLLISEPTPASSEDRSAPLFDKGESKELQARWDKIQTGFVDEPRKAVEQADELVAAAMKRLAEIFADERTNLEREWAKGEDVSTEDLRVALRRYRSFFDRLLSV